ncbi:hypothetical protein QY97_02642 [Bacillus thermotolerans]|nr:hypothetical protein QY97_02642 [Bacillus thermotolerans]
MDRFGWNKEMTLEEWIDITNNIGAEIIVWDMPLLDTDQYKDSLESFIFDLVLQVRTTPTAVVSEQRVFA